MFSEASFYCLVVQWHPPVQRGLGGFSQGIQRLAWAKHTYSASFVSYFFQNVVCDVEVAWERRVTLAWLGDRGESWSLFGCSWRVLPGSWGVWGWLASLGGRVLLRFVGGRGWSAKGFLRRLGVVLEGRGICDGKKAETRIGPKSTLNLQPIIGITSLFLHRAGA